MVVSYHQYAVFGLLRDGDVLDDDTFRETLVRWCAILRVDEPWVRKSETKRWGGGCM